MKDIKAFGERVINNLQKVMVGKRDTVETIVIGLLCEGHVLIEDVPGVGKTVLARSLARSLDCTFSRIQFTPDMLPSDVTGVSIYDQSKKKFEFRPGPVMGQIVLADEINRATPKTQAALLEAMEEHQVTVDGVTHLLARPFMVLATQNPVEYEGTFPLPEAQLDRFLLRVRLGYPNIQDEVRILEEQQLQHPLQTLKSVVKTKEILDAADAIRRVYVSPQVKRYIVDLTRRTRESDDVYLGASPRGSLGLFRSAQARAAILGREFVLPDDVKAMAVPVLGHRIIVSPAARLRDLSADQLVEEIVRAQPSPGGDFSSGPRQKTRPERSDEVLSGAERSRRTKARKEAK
ncbi:MAG: MoxR family ATPase [Anaerolineaceae bacterium]|nr:MAG: MoxR family ATPase [Anaerolineaceae bacterium]